MGVKPSWVARAAATCSGSAGSDQRLIYQHYNNKDELLTEGLMGPFAVLADMVTDARDPVRLHETIEHFWENRRVGNVLFAGRTRPLVIRTLANAIEQRLEAISRNTRASELPPPLAAAYLASAQIGLLSEWLSGQTSCPPTVVADALQRMVSGALAPSEIAG